MSRTTINFVECDCCQLSCAEDNPLAGDIRQCTMPVVYDSQWMGVGNPEQCKPYFSEKRIDLCSVCVERMIKVWPIKGTNTTEKPYEFKSSQEEV